ncbi:MAG TPA: ATP-binding protein [Gammaproteobacteria bacterium]|nr:ATP-binding protein [Gammaproteobacteria bacterium]
MATVDTALTGELDSTTRVRDAPELTWRVLQFLNAYRVLVAFFLLTLFLISDEARIVGAQRPLLFLAVAAGYAVYGLANGFAAGRRWPSLSLQAYIQLGVDILAMTTLVHASGGIGSGLGSLLVVPIGAGSLVLPRRIAFLFAALATIAILLEHSLAQFTHDARAASYTPAGLLGAILFIIASAASPLARRIQVSEALARQRGVDLANLAELNEYIIQHLRESIVVVDAECRIRLINESAARKLGAPHSSHGLPLRAVSEKLYRQLREWQNGSDDPAAGQASFVAADGSTLVNPHFAPLGKTRSGALLVFLEDASLLAVRVQQMKLASLGRLSASIAHEIRNPVGAMSHAGQLLAESPALGTEERRLTDIIHANSERVSAIINNVLKLSRRDSTRPQQLDLAEWVREFTSEFASTLELADDRIAIKATDQDIEVRMDPSHLHQILWNLCENSLKYAGDGAEGPAVELRCGRVHQAGRPYLEIADRGPGIAADKVERIFEPFFTDAQGGTGLGLFISRELCECNGATLLYEPREGGGSVFRIIFSDPERWGLVSER